MATIGLFGVCGESKWRDSFIEKYKILGIPFFNPEVGDWKPENAIEEARHLVEDSIILFPVTNQTYGAGSLVEVGFLILQTIRVDSHQDFVVMVSRDLLPGLDNGVAREESLRARALVNEHLRKLRLPNLYLVDSLEEMLEVSIRLHPTAVLREELSVFNPENKVR